MTKRKTERRWLPHLMKEVRYSGGDPGLPWEEDFAKVEGTAAGILMLMEQHQISIADIIDAVIARDHIIGVGLITVRDQLMKIVDKHLK